MSSVVGACVTHLGSKHINSRNPAEYSAASPHWPMARLCTPRTQLNCGRTPHVPPVVLKRDAYCLA
jgi:hypothetical protein